jgi:hypothetical protein
MSSALTGKAAKNAYPVLSAVCRGRRRALPPTVPSLPRAVDGADDRMSGAEDAALKEATTTARSQAAADRASITGAALEPVRHMPRLETHSPSRRIGVRSRGPIVVADQSDG